MKKNVLSGFLIASLLCFNPAFLFVKAESRDTELFNQNSEAAQVFKVNNLTLSKNDIYLMAQIVHAESKGEPFEGKVAVASVILNRASYPEFPKSIRGVIMQKNAFSCVQNGSINVVPDESSYEAVLEALKGKDPTEKAVFFYNPKTATSKWMKNVSKKCIIKIGNHVFFKA